MLLAVSSVYLAWQVGHGDVFTWAGGKGGGGKEKEMIQLDRGKGSRLSVGSVTVVWLPCRACRMGSEASCASKVEIYIHIRLHCGVLGSVAFCVVLW